ncbi:hypothetical protein CCR75_009576 [Bremia lactucae]|uniref:Lipase-like C-terminal domain-containing protein n=1 Tax=Bremia lactucae TaxID=4779 RepID=A0A976FJI5_BRELC|nr:hypothetical protein CCR75_009576 [Bremia lactucae]
MLTLFSFALLALSIVLPAHASNRFPIILVHGFTGWGRDELNGFRYWGGLQGDFETKLNDQGYTVYTAAVGPFSSNWDRACELYAVIKGGQVDYGQIHSTTYNHFRFGRNYTGLYPQWGTTNSDGSINKVHLVGHSMGGQTIRMLAQMLAYGTTGAPTVEDRLSHPLFKGGKKWVHSITTISTPNQGTTLSDGFSVIGNSVKNLAAGLANVMGLVGDIDLTAFNNSIKLTCTIPIAGKGTNGSSVDSVSLIVELGFKVSLESAPIAKTVKLVATPSGKSMDQDDRESV